MQVIIPSKIYQEYGPYCEDWNRIKFLGESLLKENAYSGNHLKIAVKALFLWIDEQIDALESKAPQPYLKH